MFKKYQKLLVGKTIVGTTRDYTVLIYLGDYIGYERDSNYQIIPQTKLICTDGNKKQLYHILPTDILEIIDGID